VNEQEKFKFSKVEELLKTMKAVFDQLGIPSNQTIKRINADDLFKGFSFVCHIDECECQLVNPDLWANGDNIIIAVRLLERFGKMKDSAERYDRIIHQPRLPERKKTGKTVDGMKPLTAREVADRMILIELGSQLEEATKVLDKAIGPRCACGWEHDEQLTTFWTHDLGPFEIPGGSAHIMIKTLHKNAINPKRPWVEFTALGVTSTSHPYQIMNKKPKSYTALVAASRDGRFRLATPSEGKDLIALSALRKARRGSKRV